MALRFVTSKVEFAGSAVATRTMPNLDLEVARRMRAWTRMRLPLIDEMR